jgi:pimeloyl-ACP methyl ester carboxylesterase
MQRGLLSVREGIRVLRSIGTRRRVLTAFASLASVPFCGLAGPRSLTRGQLNGNGEDGKATLPSGIRSRYVDTNNSVRMHVLEAGFEDRSRPCVVLLNRVSDVLGLVRALGYNQVAAVVGHDWG